MRYYNIYWGKRLVERHLQWNDAICLADFYRAEGSDDEIIITEEE